MNSEQPASVLTDAPNSLDAILEPDVALAAARRMQRWYQTPQGVAHSMFGRDGRRVDGRLQSATVDHGHSGAEAPAPAQAETDLDLDLELEAKIETEADD